MARIRRAIRRSPVTALLGPRQCGKTTLARQIADDEQPAVLFDLESQVDLARLQNPQTALGESEGLVVLDEIQKKPELLEVLRVQVDHPENRARFLILGSASPELVKGASESLAGRVEFVDLSGFSLQEVGSESLRPLWLRGGFPRSFLAETNEDSLVWREGFIRTFLQRDLPQLGISIAAPTMRRFWTMIARYHGQRWNSSEIARSMSLTDKTIRSYLDILTGAYMVRQLQPWHENIRKRQVKAPKIYFSDTGLLHSLLRIETHDDLISHPVMGASWEGFVYEQFIHMVGPGDVYFWSTHGGAELDLFFFHRGKRYGVEIKCSEAPRVTKSMKVVLSDLKLEHLWVMYPGQKVFPMAREITAYPVRELESFSVDDY